jgi:hypothetical protein
MKVTKDKSERVVKPIKGNFINLVRKGKGKDDADEEIVVLTVINQDDEVVATFAKKDHGPRYWFKAHQYCNNNSTVDERLTIREFEAK